MTDFNAGAPTEERFLSLLQSWGKTPLVSQKLGLALFASPKAGFTFAAKWFFDQMGLFDEAMAYSNWIHRYRIDCFAVSSECGESHEGFAKNPEHYLVVKLVRNPFERTVSSFIQSIRWNYNHKSLQNQLGRTWEEDSSEKYSFREYLYFLETLDLASGSQQCNPHHAHQSHILETEGFVRPDYVVRLPDVGRILPEVERRLGLPQRKPEQHRSSIHDTKRKTVSHFAGDQRWGFPNSSSQRIPVTAPNFEAFYNPDLQGTVARLFRPDFERYGFNTTYLNGQ